MSPSLLRLGLIGAGRWGQVYARTIGGLAHEGLRLSMLARHRHDPPDWLPTDCRFTDDWRTLVAADDVDAVIVSTPPSLHAEMAIAAMKVGKPVLIEKPLTMSASDAEDVAAAARATGTFAMVDHTYLFDPGFRALVDLLPRIGPIRTIQTSAGQWGPFRRDTPVLWDWGSHDLSMILTMIEADPLETTSRRLKHEILPEGDGQILSVELTFPGAVHAHIEFGNILSAKTREVRVSGPSGSLTYTPFGAHKLSMDLGDSAGPQPIPLPPDLPLTQCLREFAEGVRSGRTSHGSLALGGRIIRILTECARQTA
jgi:predicted dehydrogenase